LGLWDKQVAYGQAKGDQAAFGYIQGHFTDITLTRRFMMLDQTTPYIHGDVLEWGCHAGVDSCILRMRFGDSINLAGCDVIDGTPFQPMYAFSHLAYTRLEHPYKLPYDSAAFDVVVGEGVLEHVEDDLNSVREVHRVLKPGGTFGITCLPNQWSYTEAVQRWRRAGNHERLYTMGAATRLLEENGFKVIKTRYCLMAPTMLNGFPTALQQGYQRFARGVWAANAVLEQIPLVNRLASNLTLIATKR
jgi:SAM-dependent methyltransferase